MKQALDGLMQAQHKAAEAMYRASGAPGGGPGGAPGGGSEPQSEPGSGGSSQGDGVIDAEVVDEK
jgi:hypothetical protein